VTRYCFETRLFLNPVYCKTGQLHCEYTIPIVPIDSAPRCRFSPHPPPSSPFLPTSSLTENTFPFDLTELIKKKKYFPNSQLVTSGQYLTSCTLFTAVHLSFPETQPLNLPKVNKDSRSSVEQCRVDIFGLED
jgi:hypothetical protein